MVSLNIDMLVHCPWKEQVQRRLPGTYFGDHTRRVKIPGIEVDRRIIGVLSQQVPNRDASVFTSGRPTNTHQAARMRVAMSWKEIK